MTKILVIEDEQPILDNILEILEAADYEPRGAVDGLEGVEMAFHLMPDLILCDINMPNMDGYSVLMELRSDPRTSLIPFVFLTAYVDKPFQRRGMNLGAADYLTKPFKTHELLAAVEAQLEKAAEMEAARQADLELLRNNIIMSLPHELRTPLTGIVTCADMMLMEFEEGQTPDLTRIEQLLHIVQRSGKRLQHLTENYLVYSQIEIFAKDPERVSRLTEDEGLKGPMQIAAMALKQMATDYKRGEDLHIKGEADGVVGVSEVNWNKIITEVVDNAFKFSEPGQAITVTGGNANSGFECVVQDEGRGLQPEQVRSVGAYMQFDRKMYEQQGLGLGLSIVKRLVELHNGRLDIRSEPGQGTTVTIWLPLM